MKIVNFQTEDDLHKKMKMKALKEDKTLKQYIIDLIQEDLQKEKEQTH